VVDFLGKQTPATGAALEAWLATYSLASELAAEARGPHFSDCPALKAADLPRLTEIINEVESARKPVIGWLFSGGKLRGCGEVPGCLDFCKIARIPRRSEPGQGGSRGRPSTRCRH